MIAINANGEILLIDSKGRQIDKHTIVLGAEVLVRENDTVVAHQVLSRWDPHMIPILTEMAGKIRFEDIVIGKNDETGV